MNVKEEIQKLRNLYDGYLKNHPNGCSETILNKFLILIKKDESYELADHALDREAYNFEQRYKKEKIKPTRYPMTPKTFVEDKDLAKIYSSGEQLSEISIRIKDFIDNIKSFVAVNPISWIVGGVVNNEDDGSKNDIDILISIPTRDELEKIIMFRIARMVSPEIRKRISFLPESEHSYVGPFTNNLPLFRLTVERIQDAEIAKMSEAAGVKLRIKSDEVAKRTDEANDAIKMDKITPGKYHLHAKPVRGYKVGEAQTLENFLNIYDRYYSFPSLSSKKLDGMNTSISKIGDEVIIFSEDGSSLIKLENLKNEIKKLKPSKCVLMAELESWDFEQGQHLPRESVNPNIDDDKFVANVYDVLYFKGEIPDELYDEIEYFDKEGAIKWREKYL